MNVARALHPPLPARGLNCPPGQRLEPIIAGDPIPPEIATHLNECVGCKGYVESLRTEQDAFLKARSPELFVRKLVHRKAKSRRALWQLVLVGASVLALVVLLPQIFDTPSTSIHLKGESLGVVYKREGMIDPLPVSRDLRLRTGDVLRFTFAAERDGHLLILDLDGNRKVTSFYPFGGKRSEPIQSGSRALLPGSVVLDDAPGPEWLVAIFSTERLDAASLSEQLRQLPRSTSKIELSCGGCRIEALRIQKAP